MLGNGGSYDDEDYYYDHSGLDKRAPMRFGKRSGGSAEVSDAVANGGMYYYDPADYQQLAAAVEDVYEKRAPMRFGKRMVEDAADVKRAPMRFGK